MPILQSRVYRLLEAAITRGRRYTALHDSVLKYQLDAANGRLSYEQALTALAAETQLMGRFHQTDLIVTEEEVLYRKTHAKNAQKRKLLREKRAGTRAAKRTLPFVHHKVTDPTVPNPTHMLEEIDEFDNNPDDITGLVDETERDPVLTQAEKALQVLMSIPDEHYQDDEGYKEHQARQRALRPDLKDEK
jgi:hypothetical protein